MSLPPGTRLGPYAITSAIGAGGMGEVYRATDSHLKRAVAIKVLTASVAADADRLARFQREAELLAVLNHPNIAAIYGLEKTADLTALVMELVEGEDLSALIARGAIPIDEALPIARQIADAFEAAHEQGIIHRDLKPANIKVRPDGTVKVLDFGLAKAMDVGSSGPGKSSGPGRLSMSPTMMSPAMSGIGVILGTAAYMAPEQAKGRAVDKRADIWAFGVVLHEMLTGHRLFDADDVSETLAAVLTRGVDLTSLPADTPPRLRALVRDCLVRDPKQRLRDIGDARLVLDKIIAGAPEDAVAKTAATAAIAPPSSRALPWVAAGAVAVALGLALWAPWRVASSPPSAALRLTPLSFEQGGQISAVWSPDGKAVAYGARQKDTDPYQVYVRYLDSPVATKITDVPGVVGVNQWTTAGKIVFTKAPQQAWSVSPVGGEPEPFASTATNDATLRLVGTGSVSRDGAALAALFRGADGMVSLWTASPTSALKPYEPAPFATRSIFNAPIVRFSPDGKQILLLQNTGAEGEEAWLMPYPSSAANPPHRILQGLLTFNYTPTASWMPDNRHVVLSYGPSAAPRQLYLADTVSGAFTVVSSGTRAQDSPAVSPDGSKLVFLESETDGDVVSVDVGTAVVTRVIATQRVEQMPAWAARESALVYVTDRNGEMEIWMRKPGQLDRPLVTPRDFPPGTTSGFMGPSLSPDGARVIYGHLPVKGNPSLWMSAVAGGPPVRFVKSAAGDFPGSWSPDGNWYVYRHFQDGRESLNKVKTTGGAEPEVLKADVKRSGNWVPAWSPANDWILYGDGGVKLISPDGKTTRDVSPTSATAYAFSADGRTIYGLRQPVALSRVELFSVGVGGGPEKTIGSLAPEYLPRVSLAPSLRLSVTPDGKSLTYSISRTTSNLWLMDALKSVTVR